MRIEQFIAFRYIFSKKRFGFVNAISLISIIGVTIGVAALIIVLSVFNGFNGLVTSILVNFDPHIRVSTSNKGNMNEYDSLIKYLQASPDVSGYSAYVSGKGLIISKNLNRVVNVRGIDVESIGTVSGLRQSIVLGEMKVEKMKRNGIILGLTLADRLGAVVGDTVMMVSPAGSEMALLQLGQPLIRRFRVEAIYESNNKEYDGYYAYIDLSTAQTFFKTGANVHGVEVRLSSIHMSNKYSEKLREKFGGLYRIQTWYDLHKDLYTVMEIERWIAYVILCLIIGVASFNLLGSLTMSVIEKTRDIGILKSLGSSKKTILRVFLSQGIVVGVVGSIFGLVIGFVVLYLQTHYHLFPLDPTVYIIPAIPVVLEITDVLLVVGTAILFCSVAALYPAKRAANLIPAEALRWE